MKTPKHPQREFIVNQLRYAIRYEQDGRPVQLVTPDVDMAWYATEIVDVVSAITRNNRLMFGYSVNRLNGHLQYTAQKNVLRDRFLLIVPVGVALLQAFPHCKFHPLIELFISHTAVLPPGPLPICESDMKQLEQCVAAIRAEAKSVSGTKKRDTHRTMVRKKTEGLQHYVDALFAKWERLVVVHVELGYGIAFCEPFGSGIAYEEAVRHRKAMFCFLDRNHPIEMHGFAWKDGHACCKSFHASLLLFFDSNQPQAGTAIARSLGDEWNRITEGKGSFFNCNAHYGGPGIGLVNRGIPMEFASLRQYVVPYFTQSDDLIRFVMANRKTFDKGTPPEPAPRKRGRPSSAVKTCSNALGVTYPASPRASRS